MSRRSETRWSMRMSLSPDRTDGVIQDPQSARFLFAHTMTFILPSPLGPRCIRRPSTDLPSSLRDSRTFLYAEPLTPWYQHHVATHTCTPCMCPGASCAAEPPPAPCTFLLVLHLDKLPQRVIQFISRARGHSAALHLDCVSELVEVAAIVHDEAFAASAVLGVRVSASAEWGMATSRHQIGITRSKHVILERCVQAIDAAFVTTLPGKVRARVTTAFALTGGANIPAIGAAPVGIKRPVWNGVAELSLVVMIKYAWMTAPTRGTTTTTTTIDAITRQGKSGSGALSVPVNLCIFPRRRPDHIVATIDVALNASRWEGGEWSPALKRRTGGCGRL